MQTKALAIIAAGVTAFILVPLGFYALSDAPFRSVLKDALSIVTLLAFAMMLMQFFLARSNTALLSAFKPPLVQKVHKYIAYSAITVILLHPYLIVVPRYFEGGVKPWAAFIEMLTSFTNIGILAGIIAWVTLVAVGITAFFRMRVMRRMSGKYRGWRGLHALLVLGFVLPATFHIIDLGRHSGWGFGLYICAVLGGGLILLARLYPTHFPAKFFAKTEVKAQ